jgi:hypothetical protein
MQYVLEVLINVAETCLNLKINLAFQFRGITVLFSGEAKIGNIA